MREPVCKVGRALHVKAQGVPVETLPAGREGFDRLSPNGVQGR